MKELKLGRNIARNTALSENVFMMLVCIELRIPLFVVGKPGSSKSLAKTVVADNMQGERSPSELFKNFKQVSQKCGSRLARFASLHSFFQLGIIQPSIVIYKYNRPSTVFPPFDRDEFFIASTGKSALKLVNVRRLKVIRPKRRSYYFTRSRIFTEIF